jgi:hypothetical protein
VGFDVLLLLQQIENCETRYQDLSVGLNLNRALEAKSCLDGIERNVAEYQGILSKTFENGRLQCSRFLNWFRNPLHFCSEYIMVGGVWK